MEGIIAAFVLVAVVGTLSFGVKWLDDAVQSTPGDVHKRRDR